MNAILAHGSHAVSHVLFRNAVLRGLPGRTRRLASPCSCGSRAGRCAMCSAHRDAVPAHFAGKITLEAHHKAADYTVARTRLSIVDTLIDAAVLLALTLGGGVALLAAWVGFAADRPAADRMSRWLSRSRCSAALVALPLSWYRTFVIEQRFGFNRMTLRAVAARSCARAPDRRCARRAAAHAGALAHGARRRLWWLYAWAAWMAFQLLVLALYPTLIAPLFNKFEPLTDAGVARARRATARALQLRRQGTVRDGRLEALEPRQRLFHRLRRGTTHRVFRHAADAPPRRRGRGRARARARDISSCATCSSAPRGSPRRASRCSRCSGWLVGPTVVLRRPRRSRPRAALRRRAGAVHARAAGVHLPRRAAGVAVFAQARVRGRRLRRAQRVGVSAGRGAGQALRGQCQHADARPAALGVLRFASARGGAHRAPRSGDA